MNNWTISSGSPRRLKRDGRLNLHRADVWTIDSELFSGHVERVGGVLKVTLTLTHGPNPSKAVASPEPINVVADGPVELPQ